MDGIVGAAAGGGLVRTPRRRRMARSRSVPDRLEVASAVLDPHARHDDPAAGYADSYRREIRRPVLAGRDHLRSVAAHRIGGRRDRGHPLHPLWPRPRPGPSAAHLVDALRHRPGSTSGRTRRARRSGARTHLDSRPAGAVPARRHDRGKLVRRHRGRRLLRVPLPRHRPVRSGSVDYRGLREHGDERHRRMARRDRPIGHERQLREHRNDRRQRVRAGGRYGAGRFGRPRPLRSARGVDGRPCEPADPGPRGGGALHRGAAVRPDTHAAAEPGGGVRRCEPLVQPDGGGSEGE